MRLVLIPLFIAMAAVPGHAQTEFSIYGGYQAHLPTRVSGDDPGGLGTFSFVSDWRQQGADPGQGFGLRLTWWQDDETGWGVDLSRATITATGQTLADNGLGALELADGLNLVTLNTYRRFPPAELDITPYVGAGLGVAVPEILFATGGAPTTGRQVAGPAVQWVAGASIPLNERLSVFGEYRGSATAAMLDLINGGDLSGTVISNAVNVGVTLGF